MLTVDEHDLIRRKHLVDGMSQRAIAQELGCACREIDTFIDKRSLVQLETNSYSAPVRWAHHAVSVKAFVDRVEIWCEHERVAVHPRSYDKGQYRMALPLMW